MNWCGVVTFDNWMRLRRKPRRAAATLPPSNACRTFDGTHSNNVGSSVPPFSVKRNRTDNSRLSRILGIIRIFAAQMRQESDDDTARKGDSELVRCGWRLDPNQSGRSGYLRPRRSSSRRRGAESWRDHLYDMLKSFVGNATAEFDVDRIDEAAWQR